MSTILAQSRLRACRHWPFASHAILSMVPVSRPGLGTLAVDQHWRLYYDEAAMQQMGTEKAAGLILHELDHLLKRHHKRGKQMVGDKASRWDTWNHATDSSINAGLRSEGIPLPDGLVYPEQFGLPEGLSAEEYFRSLLDQQKQPQDEPQPEPEQHEQDEPDAGDDEPDQTAPESPDPGHEPEPPACEDGQDQGDSEAHGANDDSEGQKRDDSPDGPDSRGDDPDASGASASDVGYGENSQGADGDASHADDGDGQGEPLVDEAGNWTGEPQSGQGGSCSDGRQRPWELGSPDDDNPGLDEADQEQLVHVTAKNALAKDCGKGAGGHRRWAETILDPPVDPAARLLNMVRRCCDVTVGVGDRSYRRPSRRNGNPNMAMPSNVAPLPRITVIVDTSGSMSQDDLGLALGMIRKVLNSFRIRDGIKVITGDAKGQTKQLCLSDPRRIELTGGGGTNMAKIIAEALEARPQPQMILVCTDRWTPWPEANPGIPIVACITRKRDTLPDMYRVPDFITTLELTGERT